MDGLGQFSRRWFDKFTNVVKKPLSAINKRHTTIILYVDYIGITRNNIEVRYCLKKMLATEFEIKDFELLKYFLRMEVAQSREGLSILQIKNVGNWNDRVQACHSHVT